MPGAATHRLWESSAVVAGVAILAPVLTSQPSSRPQPTANASDGIAIELAGRCIEAKGLRLASTVRHINDINAASCGRVNKPTTLHSSSFDSPRSLDVIVKVAEAVVAATASFFEHIATIAVVVAIAKSPVGRLAAANYCQTFKTRWKTIN